MEFKEWMKQVDKELVRICGMASDDLPDVDYWSRWESGQRPISAARELMREMTDDHLTTTFDW